MSSHAERVDDVPEVTELTVEEMFAGLPPVDREEPTSRATAETSHSLRLPNQMLDAIRHYS